MFTIEPYKRQRPAARTVGVLTAAGRVLDEQGDDTPVAEALRRGVQIFAGYERAGDLLAAGQGEALCWNGPIRWRPPGSPPIKRGHSNDRSDWPVTVLRFEFPDDADAVLELARWRDWLAAFGARPLGSLGSTSFGLLKARLTKPLRCAAGEPPNLPGTVGGRQLMGREQGSYHGSFRHFDMRAAYAQELGRLRYGGRWLDVTDTPRFPLEGFVERGGLVFVRARVRVPAELEHGPLPRRPRHQQTTWESILQPTEYPIGLELQGTWTLDELRAAEHAGAEIVRRLNVWVHTAPDEERPFARWLEAIDEGRRMPGLAGTLAKATGNALWGSFAISRGRRSVESWQNQGGRLVRVRRNLPARKGQPRAFDLAEQVTGKVRAQLFDFTRAAGDRLICAHTDGGWCDAAGGWTHPGWRSKERAERIDVLSPQVLRYWRPGELEPEHVFAGYPSKLAAAAFDNLWNLEKEGRLAPA